MCKFISNLFKKKDPPKPIVIPVTNVPYPEEPPNPSQTMSNTNITLALLRWLSDYSVPRQYQTFWENSIEVRLDDTINVPALTYEQFGKRHLVIRPEYLNSGVIAHEQAHTSYSLLTEAEKKDFELDYLMVNTTPLVLRLFTTNTYGLTSFIECHAELYRYLNESMPEVLKKYYPKLM
jgi:hypothetical protein